MKHLRTAGAGGGGDNELVRTNLQGLGLFHHHSGSRTVSSCPLTALSSVPNERKNTSASPVGQQNCSSWGFRVHSDSQIKASRAFISREAGRNALQLQLFRIQLALYSLCSFSSSNIKGFSSFRRWMFGFLAFITSVIFNKCKCILKYSQRSTGIL